MATSSVKQESAMDELLDSFGEVIDSGAEKMSPSELRESEKKFNEIVDRAVSARKRPGGTAQSLPLITQSHLWIRLYPF